MWIEISSESSFKAIPTIKNQKVKSKRGVDAATEVRVKLAFALELARGASFISSTLTPESRDAAIQETLSQFVLDRGSESVDAFSEILARSLEKRGSTVGANAVRAHMSAKASSPVQALDTVSAKRLRQPRRKVRHAVSLCHEDALRPILAVEDNAMDLELLQIALTKNREMRPVIAVADGQQALDYLLREGEFSGRDGHDPKFVLLDIKMPRVSGFEVMNAIRKDNHLRNIPVIALSSSRDERDVTRAYELGANGYVVKQTDFRQFAEIIAGISTMWGVRNEFPLRGRMDSAAGV